MFRILFLHSSTSLGCFRPGTFWLNKWLGDIQRASFISDLHNKFEIITWSTPLLSYHPSDSDSWNSTQHPTWPQALSEEFTPAVNDWWMGLRCLYRWYMIYTDIEEHARICLVRNYSLWSGAMTEFYVRGITGWCWVESFQTQRGNLGDARWKLYGK